jgi:hypothetical protein
MYSGYKTSNGYTSFIYLNKFKVDLGKGPLYPDIQQGFEVWRIQYWIGVYGPYIEEVTAFGQMGQRVDVVPWTFRYFYGSNGIVSARMSLGDTDYTIISNVNFHPYAKTILDGAKEIVAKSKR